VFEENRLDDAAIERLARSRGLVGVEALKLGRNPFSDRGALALAASPALSGLTSLELADIWPMTLSTSALEALVSSPHLVRLKRLSVSCSGPHIGATLAKCSAPLRELRVCDVIEFTDTDAVAVAAAQGLVGLDAIELRSAPNEHLALTDKGAKALLARARTTIDFAPKLSAAIRLRTAPLDKA
jgi:hypothetical protein